MTSTARCATLTVLLFSGSFALRPKAYGQGGIPIWTNRAQVGGHVALDGTGNVLISGGANGGAAMKVSNSGSPLWTNSLYLSGYQSAAMAVDSNGDVVLTGYAYSSASWDDFVTIKYSSTRAPS